MVNSFNFFFFSVLCVYNVYLTNIFSINFNSFLTSRSANYTPLKLKELHVQVYYASLVSHSSFPCRLNV